MKTGHKRILSFMIAAALLFGCVVAAAPGVHAVEFENTYQNTGNQRKDIIGIALTQVGYREGPNNSTKFGTWYGLPNQEWCATFVSWCARQAQISTDILGRSAVATPDWGYFDIDAYRGDQYIPQPGDLFFTYNETHVGLVYYVEGEHFYTIEGNTNEGGSADGYGVLIRKRELGSGYKFGVPKYEGCDREHTYTFRQEQAHPHKTYYQCTTCADLYYTGYTACLDSCASCMSCGCSAATAGYYICTTDAQLYVYKSHSASSSNMVACLTKDMVVYVHGTSNGWAYIEYDGVRGHIKQRHLQAYYPAPGAPTVTAAKTYLTGETAAINWKAASYTEQYRIEIYKDGQKILDREMAMATSYSLTSLTPGKYQVRVIAGNKTGSSKPGVWDFTVYDTYTVAYDTRGGSAAPKNQIKVHGQPLTLSDAVPVKEGYTFLGWTDDAGSNTVVYKAADSYFADASLMLYAVWKADDAVLESIQINKLPDRTKFVLGAQLDTTGLELKLTYTGGVQHCVTGGFTTEGFSSQELGTKTVTVIYDTLSVTYDVQILEFISGDFNGNFQVDEDDAIYLLRHVLFAELYPISIPADFTSDAQVTEDDAIYLLRHVLFPEKYPIG